MVYTCHMCDVEFGSHEETKKHYGGGWHQYNVMRCLDNKPSICQENFDKLIKELSLDQAREVVSVYICKPCKKSFSSSGAHDAHLRSRRHRGNIARAHVNDSGCRPAHPPSGHIPPHVAAASAASEDAHNTEAGDDNTCSSEDNINAIDENTDYIENHEDVNEENTDCIKDHSDINEYNENDSKDDLYVSEYDTHVCEHNADYSEDNSNDSKDHKIETESNTDGSGYNADVSEYISTIGGKNMSVHNICIDEDHINFSEDSTDVAATKVEELDSGQSDDESKREEEMEEKYGGVLPPNVCLFCSKRSRNIAENIGHMERLHSFIIPHQSAADMDNLAAYLGRKVGARQCVQCSKEFQSLDACRFHMLDKPHLRLRLPGEYDGFFYLQDCVPATVLPRSPGDEDIYEMTLPCGVSLIHRDLRRYYRQRLPALRDQDERRGGNREEVEGSSGGAVVLRGAAGGPGAVAAQTSTARRVVRDRQWAAGSLQRQRLAVAVSANKLQPHFRDQNP